MSLNQDLLKKFHINISKDVKLSNYSWFNLGGPAEFFFRPENKIQLMEFLKENLKNKLRITILGAGSNTLIRDNGIKGVVIKENIRVLKDKYELEMLEYNYLSSPKKLIEYQKKYFENELVEADIENFNWVNIENSNTEILKITNNNE